MVLKNSEAQGCLDNAPDGLMEMLDDTILDIAMTFSKALDYTFNSLNCSTLKQFDIERYQKMMDETFSFSQNPEVQKLLTSYQKFGEQVYQEGKELGAKLKIIEKEWVNNNFHITDQQLENIIKN